MRRGALLAVTAAVVTGCGGGSDQSSSAPPPEPGESIHAFAGRLASAIEAGQRGQCGQLRELSRGGAMRLNCDAPARRAFAGFKVTGAQRYGSGGAIEFVDSETKDPKLPPGTVVSPRGARGVYTVAVGPRGRWAFTGPVSPLLPGPTIGTRPGSAAAARAAVQRFATAVRRSDCARFYKVTFTPGLDQQQACATTLGQYAPLAKQLKDGPEPRILPLGGNATFTFFGLRTGEQYRTLALIKTPGQPYLVMAAFPGPSS
ncbi:MAG: hypothetical protein ACJ760_11295 [Thermoleophilaceae bacterium]